MTASGRGHSNQIKQMSKTKVFRGPDKGRWKEIHGLKSGLLLISPMCSFPPQSIRLFNLFPRSHNHRNLCQTLYFSQIDFMYSIRTSTTWDRNSESGQAIPPGGARKTLSVWLGREIRDISPIWRVLESCEGFAQ